KIQTPPRYTLFPYTTLFRSGLAGARLKSACKVLGISDRTYQRWTKNGSVSEDKRPIAKRPSPKNKLTEEERSEIVEVANSPEFADRKSTRLNSSHVKISYAV